MLIPLLAEINSRTNNFDFLYIVSNYHMYGLSFIDYNTYCTYNYTGECTWEYRRRDRRRAKEGIRIRVLIHEPSYSIFRLPCVLYRVFLLNVLYLKKNKKE